MTIPLDANSGLTETWNGWSRPLATASAFRTFIDAWRANDPNGVWGPVAESGGYLLCSRVDGDDKPDKFPVVGRSAAGVALYDLAGWAWVLPKLRAVE